MTWGFAEHSARMDVDYHRVELFASTSVRSVFV